MIERILLFGYLVPPEVVAGFPEVSAAANEAQLGLARALERRGTQVTAVSAVLMRTVPTPEVLQAPPQRWRLHDGIEIVAPGFLNVLPAKPFSIHRRMVRAGLQAARDRAGGSEVEAVLAYNARPGVSSAARTVARRLGVPFVVWAADHVPGHRSRSPVRRLEDAWADRILERADGVIVMSGHTIGGLIGDQPWIKVDGAVAEDWRTLPMVSVRRKTVVYAGLPDRIRGAQLLLDAFARLEDPEFRLVFVGRGGLQDEIASAAALDPRIELTGFLPRADVQRQMASATVLVNPRLSSAPENRHNFPSKLLEYLASGRPVITTMAGDLDPAFEEVTIPLPSETPEVFADLLRNVCSRDERMLAELGAKGRAFVLAERSWDHQAERVADFLDRVSP